MPNELKKRICENPACRKEFQPKRKNQLCCSKKCRMEKHVIKKGVCPRCGYDPSKINPINGYETKEG